MKKTYFSIITLSLTMLLSIACSKDDDPTPLPETPTEPEVVLTDYSEEVNQYVKRKWIFAIQYRLKDTIGFTIPDTIMMMLDGKTISFADGSTASISSDRKFSVKGENARTNVIDMLDQMEQFFIGDYANQRFSINGMFPLPQDHPDTIYFSALRNNRLWIGLFDYNTGNQFDEEYYSSDIYPDNTIQYDKAFGTTSKADLNHLVIHKWGKDYFLLWNSIGNGILFWKNGKVWGYDSSILSILPWYNNGYIVWGNANDGIISRVFDAEGCIIVDYAVSVPYSSSNLIYPLNNEEFIEIMTNTLRVRSLTKQQELWYVRIPIEHNNSSKYEHSFVSKDENLYTFKVVETTIQGERKEQQYVLNIDTHEVNLL